MDKPYPEYVDLSLFNFPPHINTSILLSLEKGKPVKLEDNLYVSRCELGNNRENIQFFYYKTSRTSIDTNPYGPSSVFSNGSLLYALEGRKHRIDGPSTINRATPLRSEVPTYAFCINGKLITTELEYWIAVEKYKKESVNG